MKKFTMTVFVMFLKDDGNGNWTLNADLSCENDLALKVEILRMAEENVGL